MNQTWTKQESNIEQENGMMGREGDKVRGRRRGVTEWEDESMDSTIIFCKESLINEVWTKQEPNMEQTHPDYLFQL